jgi:RNA-directed DNA polymerase
VPSRKRVKRICETIRELTGRDQLLLDQEMVVARLNRVLTGWANYFCLGPVSKAYRAVDQHAQKPLRQWLCAKHTVPGRATGRFPKRFLYQVLGLVCLLCGRVVSRGRPRDPFSESRMRSFHIRFDERGVKTEAWCSY